ncbi:RHS repeat-associated protein [Pseudoxanthomonas sp. 3HH-4]|nr:RHS repeat-associated protein [Pseudoxanthomonas sp. 3HH-4]
MAQTTGGPSQPGVLAEPDPLSDAVSATGAEFRVDESGAATYSVPIYAVSGTAGVVPKLTLSYSSQGNDGPVGKGWAIGGLSSISRCRATREAGDFIGAATPDGNPRPVNFSSSDRFCLDGQRLIPLAATCPSVSGMSGVALATEVDSFQRVCAYTTNGSQSGPSFFTVDGKDGSTSWYGDRDNNSSANRPDGYFETNSPINPAAALNWAQTRFQDSTGNYIDYVYLENPAGAGTGEHLISEVRFTGKTNLPGQSGNSSAPYAKVVFNYGVRPATKWSKGYVSGGTLTQTRFLTSITSCGSMGCAGFEQARHYLLTYAPSASGSNVDTLVGLQECRDSTGAVCSAPTSFLWSQGKYEFATQESPGNLALDISAFSGYKYGDLNGDGRSDLVYLRSGSGGCSTSYIVSALSVLDASGRPAFGSGGIICLPAAITTRGVGAWHLLDYNGDGRDDLFVSGPAGQGWRVYPSTGIGFDASQNLIAGLSPIVPSNTAKSDQVQLADLNGDGLTDIVYPSGGAMRVRTMERQGATFGWGSERTIAIDESTIGWTHPFCNEPGYYCSYTIAGAPTKETGYNQLADFNGDSASDLLIDISEVLSSPMACTTARSAAVDGELLSHSRPNAGVRITPLLSEVVASSKRTKSDPIGCVIAYTPMLHAFTIHAADASTVLLRSYGSIGSIIDGVDPGALKIADGNGDGLTDMFFRHLGSQSWRFSQNTGAGFQAPVDLGISTYKNQTQFQDVNGDGRADALVLTDYGSYKAYAVRYALSTGGYAATASPMPGGGARLCSGSCNPDQFSPMFSDFDADGSLDFMSFKYENNPALYVSRATTRFEPRDTMVKVVNGLGSETDIVYAALTNKDVYRRDTGSRNGLNVGRGSPVVDLIASSYVVARVSSSAPIAGNPGAKASLYYRYAGGRVQAGGRGFLGFRETVTIDPNQSGGYVATTTSYAQNFPFVGVPTQTVKSAFPGQSYAAPSCLTQPITNLCYPTLGEAFPAIGGSAFSSNVQIWEVAPASLAAQVPLHVRTAGSEESVRDPYTGVQTSKTATAFSYTAGGNVSQTVVDTFNGGDTAWSMRLTTDNTYADDAARWRLGRLTSSTVTHQRPGEVPVVRTVGFSYDMGGAATGLMTEERTQPGGSADLALTKAYQLDPYGNHSMLVTCGAPAASCSTAGFQFHPSTLDAVKRYSRVEYDSLGRFPVATFEPFWTDAGGEERQTYRVLQRNIFGDPVEALDINNVRTLAIKGALGRDYFGWKKTSPNASPGNGGMTSLTTYRWCGSQVNCPVGARMRQKLASPGSPSQWVYMDVLGRTVMKAMETFNAGVADQDVSAVCTEYDITGKPRRLSNPFFLPGTAGTDGPTGLDAVCTSPSRQWTTTTYDVLGRSVHVLAADGSEVSNSYSGLATTAVDPRGNPTTQTRNGKGELVSVQDAAGLTTNYTYTADGNLKTVARDAGAGTIVNSYVYDVLGRKIQQSDPDSGTTTFQYNAMGELIVQTDGEGQRIENEIDARARVWRKTVKLANGAIESQTTSVFDTAQNGSGSVTMETTVGTYSGLVGEASSELNIVNYHYYDALGRTSGSTYQIDNQWYMSATVYDALGRVVRVQDATSLWTKTQYGNRGIVAVCESDWTDQDPNCSVPASTYQRILATDAWGNVTKERRADTAAMEVNRSFHPLTGRIASICAGSTSCNLTNEAYLWDAAGNLSSHQKESRYLEAFQYDSLNRLIEAKVLAQNGQPANQVTLSQGYDDLGNVCMKNGLGFDYAGADGCGGAAALSATPLGSQAKISPLLPSYQHPVLADNSLPAAWRDSRAHKAPETPTRRYSESSASSAGLDLGEGRRGISSYGATTGMVSMSGGSGSPHAVSQSGTGTSATFYYYDMRGNQTLRDAPGTANDRTVKYSVDNKAYEILMGNGQRVRFWYGPDGKRYKKEEAGKVTLYVNGVEVITQGGATSFKRYLGSVAIQTVIAGTVNSTRFLFQDHLGSLVRVANADGSVAEGLDYAPFGGRRSYADPAAPGSAPSTTNRGFTGHEGLDGTGVIHMNGRIYDSEVGRFMQADPFVQAPDNTQSWNAYTYVFNNPLAYTDPSGNLTFRQVLGIAIAIIGTYVTWGMDGGFFAKLGVAIAFGAASGYVATGTLRGAVTGALTAGITMGIGQLGLDIWGRIVFQGMTGGIAETLNGGNFGNGFVAAGLTAAVMPQLSGIKNDLGRITTGALLGGTISTATGGKFANGAISGAIQGAMAKRSDGIRTASRAGRAPENMELANTAMRDAQAALVKSGFYARVAANYYTSERQIAQAWGEVVLPIAEFHKVEIGAWIAQAPNGAWSVSGPWSNGAYDWVMPADAKLPLFSKTAWVHTHPSIPSGVQLSGRDNLIDNRDGELFARTHDDASDVIFALSEKVNVYSYGGSPVTLSSFSYADALMQTPSGGSNYACTIIQPVDCGN